MKDNKQQNIGGAANAPPKKTYVYEKVWFMFDGKEYVCYGKTLKEAHRKAAEKKIALESGKNKISGDMSVSKWANEWLETYKEPSVGIGQAQNYRALINTAILPEIGNYRLKDIKTIHLQRMLNERGTGKHDLSRLRGMLKSMFGRALKESLISKNPAEDLEMPEAHEGTHRSVTKHERDEILKLCETHHAGLWVLMMMRCGLRPNETRALDWRHISFDKGRVLVESAMKSKTNKIGAPKSKSGVREVPIPPMLLSKLATAKSSPYEPVFKQPTTGRRHTESSMRCLWKSFRRALDIQMGATVYRSRIIVHAVAPDLQAYCLRHTYCTDLQDGGVPINIARYLMGHADIGTTSRVYTHTTDKAINEAAEKVAAIESA